ncbi:hypothetical protein [Halobacteriovorax sp. JY17]|uniref:hypothetical protein n=1 Tax=Halobacteriovorax sp. JY17 TaxID=2014617 RepID=UPI000C507306|nr:hypothetical protein [Halobacteriovorax sp. JY17]PIK13742.1 MAG: hypothetical protein CES88_16255 [Halobacteriovorax sp. JY17]
MKHERVLEFIIRLSTFTVLFGRGIQHLFYDAPYRIILWNEGLLSPIFNLFGWSWTDYVTSPVTDRLINLSVIFVGVILLLTSLVVVFNYRKGEKLLYLSGAYLVVLSGLYMSSKFFIPAQFIEYSAQMFSPFALILFWKKGESDKLILFIRIAVALTFIGHGSYALGIFPVPGNFIDMVINIIGCSESSARILLQVMGGLDFLAAILIFLPLVDQWALGFCCMWGALTSFARIGEESVFGLSHTLLTLGHEFIMRGPHFLLPLFLIYSAQKKAFNFLKATNIRK